METSTVLHNDPQCWELDENGNRVTCQLNPRDKRNVTDVYNDLNNVIDKGQSQEFVERLGSAIAALKRKA